MTGYKMVDALIYAGVLIGFMVAADQESWSGVAGLGGLLFVLTVDAATNRIIEAIQVNPPVDSTGGA